MSWGLSDDDCAGCSELISSEKEIDRLHKENTRLKELNREMVQALSLIKALTKERPRSGLQKDWEEALNKAWEVLAKAEEGEGE